MQVAQSPCAEQCIERVHHSSRCQPSKPSRESELPRQPTPPQARRSARARSSRSAPDDRAAGGAPARRGTRSSRRSFRLGCRRVRPPTRRGRTRRGVRLSEPIEVPAPSTLATSRTQRGRRQRDERRVLEDAGRVEHAPQRRAGGGPARAAPRAQLARPRRTPPRGRVPCRSSAAIAACLDGWSSATDQHQHPRPGASHPATSSPRPPSPPVMTYVPSSRHGEALPHGYGDRRRPIHVRYHVLADVRARHE
jgi:hypothetical protein